MPPLISHLPNPGISLPIIGTPWERPDADLIARMAVVSSATASADLHKLGIRHSFIRGPVTRQPGAKLVGAALTLQFMPQREDVASGIAQEEVEQRSALWHVLDAVLPGDVLVVAAGGDPYTGCLGEMLLTYLHGRGGIGAVVDGCIRDWPRVRELGLPIWTTGLTPNYASQAGQFPWAYGVPIACGGVLVIPGDIVIADDDGVVLVPRRTIATGEDTRPRGVGGVQSHAAGGGRLDLALLPTVSRGPRRVCAVESRAIGFVGPGGRIAARADPGGGGAGGRIALRPCGFIRALRGPGGRGDAACGVSTTPPGPPGCAIGPGAAGR